jgi:hypothetical protein
MPVRMQTNPVIWATGFKVITCGHYHQKGLAGLLECAHFRIEDRKGTALIRRLARYIR